MLNTPPVSFNRRRDACFPATSGGCTSASQYAGFQSQTRRLLPRNVVLGHVARQHIRGFNRRRDACFPATSTSQRKETAYLSFQSQTRRLLPRNRFVAVAGF